MTQEDILKALGNVQEPDLGKDLVTLNMVKDIVINDNKVSFTIVLTTPACPMKDLMKNASVNAIKILVNKDADVTATAAKIKKQVDDQLNKSKALIDALWTVFYAEREGNTKDYELEPVSEGNENTERSVISMESGIGSISSSQLVDLRKNSLVILDEYESA